MVLFLFATCQLKKVLIIHIVVTQVCIIWIITYFTQIRDCLIVSTEQSRNNYALRFF